MYCPDRILIRSESAVFILRGAYGAIPEAPYPTPTAPTFADVSRSYWGFGWIESLWKDGYTAGCGTNPLIFCPQRNHTRAEGSGLQSGLAAGVPQQSAQVLPGGCAQPGLGGVHDDPGQGDGPPDGYPCAVRVRPSAVV
jgi:hypothetical protein